MFSVKSICCAISLAFTTAAAQAVPVSYLVNWDGNNGYALGGIFTFDSVHLGTVIDEADLTRLTFDVTLNGVSLGTADSPTFDGRFGFNFNFDTVTETLLVGGTSGGLTGQVWNYTGSTVGFVSGTGSQIVTVNGVGIADATIPTSASTLRVTALPTPAVPVPASLPLLFAGLGAVAVIGRRGATRAGAPCPNCS